MESHGDTVSPGSPPDETATSQAVHEEPPSSARLQRPLSMSMYSTLPEAVERPVESDKQVVQDDGKEVASPNEKEAARNEKEANEKEAAATGENLPEFVDLENKEGNGFLGPTNRQESFEKPADGTSDEPRRRRICGLSLLVFGLIIGGLVILAIALGVGLGVGLGTQSKSHAASGTPTPTSNATSTTITPSQPATATPTVAEQTLIGGSVNPQYYSTSGAFNGSGFDINSGAFISNYPGFNGSNGQVILYFQHWTGDIRWMAKNATGWYGGDANHTVATDAKNATSITSQDFSYNGTSYWHVFYINVNNTVSQRTLSTVTNQWVNGPLNNLKLPALDDERVGLLACYYGGGTGDTEIDGSTVNGGIGMRLWAASDNTTFNQVSWTSSTNMWTANAPWMDLNAHAMPSCYTWGGNDTTYTLFVNLNNSISIFWRDTSSGVIGTSVHPINIWTNANATIPDIGPSTQLNIGVFQPNLLWGQLASSTLVQGWNITWAAENTTVNFDQNITVQGSGRSSLPGTHIALATVNDPVVAEQDIVIFDQTIGNDITVYTRRLSQISSPGAWDTMMLTIPSS